MKYNLDGQKGPEGEINPENIAAGPYIYDNAPGLDPENKGLTEDKKPVDPELHETKQTGIPLKGNAFDVISSQLSLILKGFSEKEFSSIVIAYEPVWAIGTGLTASASDAQQMHQHIRNLIAESFNAELANNISIIYGGSCKPENAKELFSQKDIDGGLIGGAALQYDSFMSIVKAF